MSQAGVLSVSGSSGIVETLTGNSGGAVSPSGSDNINVVGDGTTVNVVGNPATHTLTISAIPGGSGIETIDGDSGSITGSTVTIFANHAGLICGSTVKFVNSGTISTLNVTDSGDNTIIGLGSGSATLSGTLNTVLGQDNLGAITSGSTNVIIGAESGDLISSGSDNIAIGVGIFEALTTGGDNIGIGLSSLESVVTGNYNIGIGNDTLGLLGTNSSANIAIGYSAVPRVTSGTGNLGIGYASLNAATGSPNMAIGWTSLSNVITGTNNLAIGYNVGENYVGAESSNILIGSLGVAAESNVIRIGIQGTGAGQQSTCYIAGIEGVSVSNLNYVTINTSTGQLGSAASVVVPALTITSVTHVASPYTVLSTDQFLACQTSGGVITIKLPNAPTTGRVIYIKDSNGAAATNNISVTTVGGSVTIDGQTTYTLATNYQSISVVFDGSNYEVF